MYQSTDICAVIVTYNCEPAINDNIASLLKQVQHVLIVDNHSKPESREILKSWNNHEHVTLIFNEKNEGISMSLNAALQFAQENRYPLLLTMDQDCVLYEECVEKLLVELNQNEDVAAVGPNRKPERTDTREKSYLITSGCLVVVEKAVEAGGYDNDLFVDMVDFDFSLALRKKGYRLLMVGNAYMHHKVGVYEENMILGKKYRYLSHSPDRFYHMYRGKVILIKKYFSKFPLFCMKMMLITAKETLTMQFEANAKEKNSKMCKGVKSGLSYKVVKDGRI